MRLHHIGVAVPAASSLLPVLDLFGFRGAGSGIVERFRCRCTFYQNEDQQMIEVVEPLPGQGTIRQFVDAHGVALHHVAFEVPDLIAAVRAMFRAGRRFQTGIERGALPGMYVAFLDRHTTEEILIELVEFRPAEG